MILGAEGEVCLADQGRMGLEGLGLEEAREEVDCSMVAGLEMADFLVGNGGGEKGCLRDLVVGEDTVEVEEGEDTEW